MHYFSCHLAPQVCARLLLLRRRRALRCDLILQGGSHAARDRAVEGPPPLLYNVGHPGRGGLHPSRASRARRRRLTNELAAHHSAAAQAAAYREARCDAALATRLAYNAQAAALDGPCDGAARRGELPCRVGPLRAVARLCSSKASLCKQAHTCSRASTRRHVTMAGMLSSYSPAI
jgi:hypothetical protein